MSEFLPEAIINSLFNRLRRNFNIGTREYLAALDAVKGGWGSDNLENLRLVLQLLWCNSLAQQSQFAEIWESAIAQITQDSPKLPPERLKTEPPAKTSNFSQPLETTQQSVPKLEPLPLKAPLTPDAPEDLFPGTAFIPADTEDFPEVINYWPITRRSLAYNWRYLQRPIADGPADILDVQTTVQQSAQQGFFLAPVYRRRELNHAQVLLLVDQEGSMTPLHPFTRDVVDTAQNSFLEKVAVYYFHNVPDSIVYRDSRLTTPVSLEQVLADCDLDTSVLIFSDAGAARNSRRMARIGATTEFLVKLKRRTNLIAWLNPLPVMRWEGTSAELIAYLVPTEQMDEDGFSNAIDLVRGLSISNYKASRSRKPLGKRRGMPAREGDFSLDRELKQAKQRVDWFVRRFHPSYRLLLYYAALPLILTPELLNYLRNQFLLYQVPWVAEVDILLSDLCNPVGYEQYEMDKSVRSYLLQEMEQELGNKQIQKIASRLISYIRHLAHTNPYISPQELEAQQWAAMVYLDEHRTQAEKEIATALQALVNRGKNGKAELARLQRLIKEFRPQLSPYDPLIKFAKSLGIWLKGQIPPDASQSYTVHGVKLRLPEIFNQSTQLEGFPALQNFECEVATIALKAGAEISPKIELEPFDFEVATIELKPMGRLRIKKELIVKLRQQQAYRFIEDLGNGVELEMVAIPKGSFLMGSPNNELERRSSESPQHRVMVKSFLMGKYPVTQAQWQALAALPPVNTDKPNPSRFKGASRPVERVSWYDAVEFCARLSRKTGRQYRLPSEAEWEYACRAGTTTPFHFGETITTDLANYDGDYTYGSGSKGKSPGETTPVGSFKVANAFGLYDMHGNVWEWCADHWHGNYEGAPTDGSAWVNENDNRSRLLRGGSWDDIPVFCRSAYRGDYDPGGSLIDFFGFRVLCEAAWTL